MFDEPKEEVIEMSPSEMVGSYVHIEVGERLRGGYIRWSGGKYYVKTLSNKRIDLEDGSEVFLGQSKKVILRYPK